MGDKNPIRTHEDYSKPSYEVYRNTIELPEENNVVPLRSDTIRLVQNGCSFHGLWSEDPYQHLKDFLKLVDSLDLNGDNRERKRLRLFQFSLHDQASNWLERLPAGSISTWEDLTTRFLAQFFPPGRTAKLCNDILMFQQHQGESLSEAWTRFKDLLQKSAGGKLRDRIAEESWELLEDLALYDNKSWNDPRYFAKPVKAISLPQDVPNARLSKFEADFKQQQSEMTNKIDTVLKAITDRITGALLSDTVNNPKMNVNSTTSVLSARSYPTDDPQCSTPRRKEKTENIDTTPPSPPDPSISFITEKVYKLNSFLESSGLVPQSSDTEFVCTKGDDGDVMFIEIIRNNDDSHEEGTENEGNATTEGLEVEYFDTFPTKNFMIVEDIGSIIDPRLSQVVLGKPFVEISNMTHDPPEGVVRFTNGTDQVAYKMPHKIEQYNSLSDLEKEHIKSVYLRNKADKRRGVEYAMSKILGFYKECLELGPEYLTGVADEG
ncbi:MAK10-like protein [Tanacetum coccineum]